MAEFEFLRGVFNITPTPFDENGQLDEESLVTLTEFNIRAGVDGMTILGVMGEASKLTDLERARVIESVVIAADGRIPICVGATHAGTDGAVAYAQQAQDLGAAALMIAPPKMGRSNDEVMRHHYLTIAEAVEIPIVVQDHPPSSGVYMSVEFIAGLAQEAPLCRYLKQEDIPSPAKISRVLDAYPDLQVFGGSGGIMFLEELKHGANGSMTGFGFPDILADIYRKFIRGDVDGATDTFYRYCPVIRFEAQEGIGLSLRKEIYRRRGAISCARARAPFVPVDERTMADLDDLLFRLELS